MAGEETQEPCYEECVFLFGKQYHRGDCPNLPVTRKTKSARLLAVSQRALRRIIAMNRMHAKDQYGDPEIAESWACVTVARAALEGRKS